MKSPSRTTRRALNVFTALVAVSTCLLGLGAGTASASFGIESYDGEVITESGEAATQAGSRPYEATNDFSVSHHTEEGFCPPSFVCEVPDGSFKDIEVKLPPGMVGNPTAVPTCPQRDFSVDIIFSGPDPNCPKASAIGTALLKGNTIFFPMKTVVYNLEPGPNEPARFGFRALTASIIIHPSIRTGGDYGVTMRIHDSSQLASVVGSEVRFWGYPGDPSHEEDRGGPFSQPVRPFLTNPTSCSGPTLTSIRMNSWEEPSSYQSASFLSHNSADEPVGIEGCAKLPFNPSLTATVNPGKADSPGGLKVDLHIPQNEPPKGIEGGESLATSMLKGAKVTLPKGVSINTTAASGLSACSEAAIGLHKNEPAHCPESSKIGDVKIHTPLLEDPLEGGLYIAKQGENPFGTLLAGYLVAEGHGVVIKQAGKFSLDPETGQLTATFEDTPQQPFEDLELSLYGGPHAVLQMPHACGSYVTRYELTPWSGAAPVTGTSSFMIDEGCRTGGFDPKLSAGTTNPVAGVHSPFVFDTTRSDGEQNIAGIDVNLPEGLTAKLAGIPLCPEADAGSGNCPAASQVGTVNVAVGAGSSPLWVPQPGKEPTAAFLAGPYEGAPYSIIAKIPAQAGPFDLGTVTVRSKVKVDPETAKVSVQSDSLPQILQGIPIDYRKIQVNVDKPDFMLNPTSCEVMSVDSSISSDSGASAHPSSRFQVGSCAELGFKPKLGLRFFGETHRSAHPKLRAVLRARNGDASIGKAVVTLPKTEFLENAHIRTICTRVQYAADNCPKDSIYGYATAVTPLLDQPLQGPVYLRSSNHPLPDLVASLDGQIHVDLAGRIDSVHGRIRNTFWAVPDAPVSKFVLTMQGGRKGLLVNNTELCAAKPRASAEFIGHNGKVSRSNPLVKASCGRKHGKRHSRHRR